MAILVENGSDASCGDYGVTVKKTISHFTNCASMEVSYDEFIDNKHTFHGAVLPWEHGKKVTVDYVTKLLNSANVPDFIQNVSAVNMILRCVDKIIEDMRMYEEAAELSSVCVVILSDKDTVDYSEYFGEEYDQDYEE